MALPMGGPPSPISPSSNEEFATAPSRPNSRTSTNSSASGVSLTRKPRTRTRAKTLTGVRPENIRIPPANASATTTMTCDGDGDGVKSAPVHVNRAVTSVNDPEVISSPPPAGDHVVTPTQASFDLAPPERPLRSVQRRSMTSLPFGVQNSFSAFQDTRPPQARHNSESHDPHRISRAWSAGEISGAARESWRIPPDSPSTQGSFHFPTERIRPQVRDSVLSHTTSSSVFPPSTSSASGVRSPSTPRSLPAFTNHEDASPSRLKFDGDDVSYRLQLLVKNNYFLPPAHSKPSPQDFASSPPKSRRPTPTFLDIFRVGRTRPRPPLTPDPSIEYVGPVLRTTSDSTTASGHFPRPPQTAPARSQHDAAAATAAQEPVARVVVVREKVADLASAAKQAELDLKTRREREQVLSRGRLAAAQQTDHVRDELEVIDPTEFVDIPPPSKEYPFAMQPSALHAVTAKDAVGAADLAEHLPPPHSPGMSSSFEMEEVAWRKALLQEAVNLSLHSPDSSFAGSSSTTTTTSGKSSSSRAPQASTSVSGQPSAGSRTENSRTPSVKRMLGQRIIQQLVAEDIVFGSSVDESLSGFPTTSTPLSGRLAAPLSAGATIDGEVGPSAIRQSYLPTRAETPSTLYPLAPAPPRKMSNPNVSLILPGNGGDGGMHTRNRSATPTKLLRKSVSSPGLSDLYGSDRGEVVMPRPPPVPVPVLQVSATQSQLQSVAVAASSDTHMSSSMDSHRWVESMVSSSSCYTYDQEEPEEVPPRPSLTLSVDQPSLSEYSQPSPQGSAFRDAFRDPFSQDGDDSGSITNPIGQRPRTTTPANPPPPQRFSTVSPPPRRVSSSSSSASHHMALSPPPRSSSLNYPAAGRYLITVSSPNSALPPPLPPPPLLASLPPSSASDPGHGWRPSIEEEERVEVEAERHPQTAVQPSPPEPTSPTTIAERRRSATIPSSLHIPSGGPFIPASVHSAPPSSPISFFDEIESNAVNEMASSDSDSDSEDSDVENGDGYRTANQSMARLTPGPPPPVPPLPSFLHDTRLPPLPAELAHPLRELSAEERRRLTSGKRPFMRLGNHSTPYVSRTAGTEGGVGSGMGSPVSYTFFGDRKSTLTVVPRRLPYFSRSSKRHLAGAGEYHGSPLSNANYFFMPQPPSSLREPDREQRRSVSTENDVVAYSHKHRESLRRLDGMLIQHMERERDTIRRIASSTVSKT